MHCPFCSAIDTKVIDSRLVAEGNNVRRRRLAVRSRDRDNGSRLTSGQPHRGLEAMFSADSALTRELIVQGTARLKETLAQAGMTVASMTVNGDQTRQSGGNSTPQQGYKAAPDALPTKARVEEPRAVVAQPPAVTATDRLNILA